MKKLFTLLLVLTMGFAACAPDEELNEFAQCLDESGAVYYGAYWCPNCQRQSELFGDSKEFLNYIECGEGVEESQTEVCLLEGIEAYPTWRFADGTELVGYQGLEDLAAASGCALPGQESIMLQPSSTDTQGDE